MGYSSRLSHRQTKRFNNFKNHADRIIDSNQTEHYMEMDGVDEYIDCGNDASLDFERTDSFSISYWFNKNTATSMRGITRASPLNDIGYNTTLLDTGVRCQIVSSGPNQISKDFTITINALTWYYLTMTYDGSSDESGLKIYINGVEVTNTTVITNTLSNSITNSNTFNIGTTGQKITGALFYGKIDEVSVWNKELTQTEVTEIYNKGRINVNYSDMTNYSNCVSHWQLGEGETSSWNGSTWTLEDKVGSNTGTSVNMEYEDVKPTEIVTTFGSLSGTGKWYCGVLTKNGIIYTIPSSSTQVLKIDTNNDTTELIGTLSGTAKWSSGVLANNNCIYAVPFNATTILKINTITDEITTFGSLAGTIKWIGSVLAPNGYIYAVPYNATTILKIDPNTDTYEEIGSLAGTSKWQGCVLAPNGCIYGIPKDVTTILKIDTNTDTVSTFGSISGSGKCIGGTLSPDGRYIYGTQFDLAGVLKIDTKTDTTSTISQSFSNNGWIGSVLAANGCIYAVPYESNNILKIDPTTDTITRFGNLSALSNNAKFVGAVFSNNAIYGIPSGSTQIVKIDLSDISQNNFGEDFSMSSYYNKL